MIASLTPPAYVAPSNVGVDRLITIIRNQLIQAIPEGNCLGRVEPQQVDGKVEPWIRRPGTDEYYRAYPNDTLTPMVFSCIYAHDNERWLDQYRCQRSLSVIVWANLSQIGVSRETLKESVHKALIRLSSVDPATMLIKDQTVSGANGIYPGFNVEGLEERYLTAPYAGFRFEFTAYYQDICYSL